MAIVAAEDTWGVAVVAGAAPAGVELAAAGGAAVGVGVELGAEGAGGVVAAADEFGVDAGAGVAAGAAGLRPLNAVAMSEEDK
jgi:hypothetical protein